MNRETRLFSDKLKIPGAVGLFYYSGHGMQVNNDDYMVPINAEITMKKMLPSTAFH
jgi:uncharacterized caspase-like protein